MERGRLGFPDRPPVFEAYTYLFLGFGFVLMVSTTVVLGRRCASLTGIYFPVLALRPIFLVEDAIAASFLRKVETATAPRCLVHLAVYQGLETYG